MTYVGIDPGQNGAYAVISDIDMGRIVKVYPWDDVFFVAEMHALQHSGDGVMVCVEKVGAMPGQGVTSMFNFGKSAGYIEGVLRGLGLPFQLIVPRRWKGEFGLIGKEKKASVDVARKLFPLVSLRKSNRCRTDSDGMADALLMAEYARRKL